MKQHHFAVVCTAALQNYTQIRMLCQQLFTHLLSRYSPAIICTADERTCRGVAAGPIV